MSQTMSEEKKSKQISRPLRPGQRQQEKMQRRQRRRYRLRVTILTILALLIITAAIVGLVQYNNYTTSQTTILHANETATVDTANKNATATVQAMITKPAETLQPIEGTYQKTANGVQYLDTKVGTGPEVGQGSIVSVIYSGWLQADGKKFDSSYDHDPKQTLDMTVGAGQVIPGLEEGLMGAKEGSSRRIIIPPDQAYGDQGGGNGVIPANATLVFDIIIVKIEQPS